MLVCEAFPGQQTPALWVEMGLRFNNLTRHGPRSSEDCYTLYFSCHPHIQSSPMLAHNFLLLVSGVVTRDISCSHQPGSSHLSDTPSLSADHFAAAPFLNVSLPFVCSRSCSVHLSISPSAPFRHWFSSFIISSASAALVSGSSVDDHQCLDPTGGFMLPLLVLLRADTT